MYSADFQLDNLLNVDICNDILLKSLKIDNASDLEIINYNITPNLTFAIGVLPDFFDLKIQYKINNEENTKLYFIKSAPISNVIRKKVLDQMNVFSKEIALYEKLFPKIQNENLSAWHADCYYFRKNVLVLEHIIEAGYSNLPTQELFTIDHLKVALSKLAEMHASSLLFELRTQSNIAEEFEELLIPSFARKDNQFFIAGLKTVRAIAKAHHKYKGPQYKDFLMYKLYPNLEPVFKLRETASNDFINVLCHRDLWGKNILFKYGHSIGKPVECIFVDFEMCRYHSPSMDVLDLIYLNTNRAQREDRLEELLRFYYEALEDTISRAGAQVNRLTWANFRRNCETVKLSTLIQNAVIAPFRYIPENVIKDLREEGQSYRLTNYLTANRNQLVMAMLRRDSFYRGMVYEALEELMEHIYRPPRQVYALNVRIQVI